MRTRTSRAFRPRSNVRDKANEAFREAIDRIVQDQSLTKREKLQRLEKLLAAEEEATDAIEDAGDLRGNDDEPITESTRQRLYGEGDLRAKLARRRAPARKRPIAFTESRRDRHDNDDLKLPADSKGLARAIGCYR